MFKKNEDKIIEKDIGLIEDTWGFLCDMVAYEDHCLNQYISSEEEKDLLELNWMRKKRTHYMDLIGENLKGNNWCKVKHLCRIAKGLQEDCSRYLSMNNLEEAKKCARDYSDCYFKFLELIDIDLSKEPKINSSA